MATPALPHLKTLFDLVKFEHTVFALPFAYAGMLLAAQKTLGTGWPGLSVVLWVTLAMAGARTAAMAANRLIDARLDALNPRTAGRDIPRGRVSPVQAAALTVLSLGVLLLAASNLNPLTLKLLPVAVFFLIAYPYTKRFTWLCHVWLGVTDGAAAAGGWIAVTGRWDWTAVALWLVVVFWMVGLDVIYATQDLDFDRAQRVQSIPARFGLTRSLRVAAWAHALTFAALLLTGLLAGAAWPYYAAALVMGAILLVEHRLVNPHDLTKVNVAFFDANMWLSLTMLLGVALDVAWRSFI